MYAGLMLLAVVCGVVGVYQTHRWSRFLPSNEARSAKRWLIFDVAALAIILIFATQLRHDGTTLPMMIFVFSCAGMVVAWLMGRGRRSQSEVAESAAGE